MRRRSARELAVLLTVPLIGCGGTGVPAVSAPQPAAACVIGEGAPAATVSVALLQPVDAGHAPAARTPAERLLFRQLYETLVRVDCTGSVLPGVAETWSAEDERGNAWQFRLREDAAFWDGSPVTARAIMESWSATHVSSRVSAAFASVTSLGERLLRVELRAPALHPYVFAAPDFAIARRAADASLPIGSGPYRVDGSAAAGVTRIVQRAAAASGPAAIEFRTVAGADPRGALDAGADLLVTADPSAVAYARALPDYAITPLPWSRTYTLLARAPQLSRDTVMGPSTDALAGLARDAVPAGTRPALPPFWWQDTACPPASPVPPAPAPHPSSARVVYPRGDAVARGLAERLVALGWPASRAPAWLRALLPADYAAAGAPFVAGLAERAALDSLLAGRALAFVGPLPRSAASACAPVALGGAPTALTLLGSAGWRITPLLDAHDFAVHRGNFGRATVESDGTIRFGGGAP